MADFEADSVSLLTHLRSMDPYEFEALVGSLWDQIGYDIEVQSGSRDRGIDIVAQRSDPFDRKQLLQTKRYTEGNRIGSQEIRTYRTLYDQEDDVDTVAIITTGEFTSQGSHLAEELNVELVDGQQLCNLIREHAPDIEEEYFGSSVESVSRDQGQSNGTKYQHLLEDNPNEQESNRQSTDQEYKNNDSKKQNRPSNQNDHKSGKEEITEPSSSKSIVDTIERYTKEVKKIDTSK